MGVQIQLEKITDKGIIDGILLLEKQVYVIEFKYQSGGKMVSLLTKSIRQIKDKKYYESYLGGHRKIMLLGVGFLDKEIGYAVELLD